MKMKHFMDIQRIREEKEDISISNTKGFEQGDHIVIQEKVDGANASIAYDSETGKMAVFSRNRELFDDKALKGFWSYVQTLPVEKFLDTKAYVIFGEWLIPHAVKYHPEAYNQWYVYDIYDKEKKIYLPQDTVKQFCREHDLIYVKTFYDGPFISWDHCRKFMKQSEIALEDAEGVVIKNQTKLNCQDKNTPFVIKILGDKFAEVKKRKKVQEKNNALTAAQEIVNQIVTTRRVEKEWMKMRDEGLVGDRKMKSDIQIFVKYLPRRIYQDCVKEEPEMVAACGKSFGKLCQQRVMQLIGKWFEI